MPAGKRNLRPLEIGPVYEEFREGVAGFFVRAAGEYADDAAVVPHAGGDDAPARVLGVSGFHAVHAGDGVDKPVAVDQLKFVESRIVTADAGHPCGTPFDHVLVF